MQKKILHGRRFYWPLRKTDSVYLPFKNMQQACILYFCPNNGSKQFQTLHKGPKGPPRQKFPGQRLECIAQTHHHIFHFSAVLVIFVLILKMTPNKIHPHSIFLFSELFEGAGHQLPSWVLQLCLLRQDPRQPPFLPGGRPALLWGGWGQRIEKWKSSIVTIYQFYFRLERVVHDKVHRLRVPYWGGWPLGGGSQQQLPLTMF